MRKSIQEQRTLKVQILCDCIIRTCTRKKRRRQLQVSCMGSFLVHSDFQRACAKDESRDNTKDDERRAPNLKQTQKVWCPEASEAHPWKQKGLGLRKEAQKETDRPAAWSRKNSEQFPFCFVPIFTNFRLDAGKRRACWLRATKAPNRHPPSCLLKVESLRPQGKISQRSKRLTDDTRTTFRHLM